MQQPPHHTAVLCGCKQTTPTAARTWKQRAAMGENEVLYRQLGGLAVVLAGHNILRPVSEGTFTSNVDCFAVDGHLRGRDLP
ncbi:hypothetical protein CCHOA_02200 [Corynebacterium choanae]|uniref:Uncharacterized protein n=1 Tax=Corynebacterium choanae TaxID=1862358 RepID=A0A3G6J4J4_9CORY|nr:hypothetical protein CCHOA_02200 [Corynebacterium choanae]